MFLVYKEARSGQWLAGTGAIAVMLYSCWEPRSSAKTPSLTAEPSLRHLQLYLFKHLSLSSCVSACQDVAVQVGGQHSGFSSCFSLLLKFLCCEFQASWPKTFRVIKGTPHPASCGVQRSNPGFCTKCSLHLTSETVSLTELGTP